MIGFGYLCEWLKRGECGIPDREARVLAESWTWVLKPFSFMNSLKLGDTEIFASWEVNEHGLRGQQMSAQ